MLNPYILLSSADQHPDVERVRFGENSGPIDSLIASTVFRTANAIDHLIHRLSRKPAS